MRLNFLDCKQITLCCTQLHFERRHKSDISIVMVSALQWKEFQMKKKNDADKVQKLSSDLSLVYSFHIGLWFHFTFLFFQDGKKQLLPGLQTAHFPLSVQLRYVFCSCHGGFQQPRHFRNVNFLLLLLQQQEPITLECPSVSSNCHCTLHLNFI